MSRTKLSRLNRLSARSRTKNEDSVAHLPIITVMETKRLSSWGVARPAYRVVKKNVRKKDKCRKDARELKRPKRSDAGLSPLLIARHKETAPGSSPIKTTRRRGRKPVVNVTVPRRAHNGMNKSTSLSAFISH